MLEQIWTVENQEDRAWAAFPHTVLEAPGQGGSQAPFLEQPRKMELCLYA